MLHRQHLRRQPDSGPMSLPRADEVERAHRQLRTPMGSTWFNEVCWWEIVILPIIPERALVRRLSWCWSLDFWHSSVCTHPGKTSCARAPFHNSICCCPSYTFRTIPRPLDSDYLFSDRHSLPLNLETWTCRSSISARRRTVPTPVRFRPVSCRVACNPAPAVFRRWPFTEDRQVQPMWSPFETG